MRARAKVLGRQRLRLLQRQNYDLIPTHSLRGKARGDVNESQSFSEDIA
jgi:hypothetical protein